MKTPRVSPIGLRPRGFIGLPVLLAIIAVFVIAGGATTWYLSERQAPPNPQLQEAMQSKDQPADVVQIDQYFSKDTEHVYYVDASSDETAGGFSTSTKILTGADPATFKRISEPVKTDSPEGSTITVRYEDKNAMFTISVYSGMSGVRTTVSTAPLSDSNIPISVVPYGMSKYTDPDLGYSFWYPSGWYVKSNQDPQALAGHDLTMGDSSDGIIIKPIAYSDGTITTSAAGCTAHYFYEAADARWMQSISGCDGATNTPTPLDSASFTTMGGVPALFSQNGLSNQSYIVPLHAKDATIALIVSPSGSFKGFAQFVKTITVSDPAAAPVGAAEQIQIIQAEKDAYAGQ